MNSNLRDSSLKKSQFFFNSEGLLFKNKIKQSTSNLKNLNYGTVSFIKNSFIYAMNKVKPSKDTLEIGLTTPQLKKGYRNQTNTNLAKIYFIKKLQGYALARSKKTFEKHKSLNFSFFFASFPSLRSRRSEPFPSLTTFPSIPPTAFGFANRSEGMEKESEKDKGKKNEATFDLKPMTFQGSLVRSSMIPKTSKILSWGSKKNIRSRELYFKKTQKKKALNNVSLSSIHIFLAEKRKVQIGDKMAGRHGNKGIISQILPREDMPYLPDGTPLDMILNPLGVPSRMNVGQIYECLLGFAGKYLGENYKVFPFDEIYGPEASRSFVYSKLYEARAKTGFDWLYNPKNPGKIRLYDGRTGESFDQAITVGDSYILRLVHMVDDKIHARSTGPYSLVTQQPLRGRSKQGGQRLGEMEVWALEGYGAAFTLLEMLTIKSDDMTGRMTLWSNLILNKDISIGTPESFKVLVCELQALCLDIGLFRSNPGNKVSLNEIDSLMNLP